MSGPISASESKRLAALEALDIVGSEPEAVFGNIVELVSQATGAPIALISLVTRDMLKLSTSASFWRPIGNALR